jgi:S-adenosylmethionine decarboxylase
LNFLIHSFDSDVLSIDYRVRGFTRDIEGTKHYMDHKMSSIQKFISKEIINDYIAIDVNNYQEKLFHTKMMRTKVDLDHYLFGGAANKIGSKSERERVKVRLSEEIQEIFNGRNADSE